jgi:hypothetical protein
MATLGELDDLELDRRPALDGIGLGQQLDASGVPDTNMRSVHVAGARSAGTFPQCGAVSRPQSMRTIVALAALRHIGPAT